MQALGVEGEGFGAAFDALRWEFLAVPEEADRSGVADSYDQFARGMESGRGRGDQHFPGDELSVGGDRDPGIFAGADNQSDLDCRFLGRFRRRIAKGPDGQVVFLFDRDCVGLLLRFRLYRRGRGATGQWEIWCSGG